MIYELKIVYCVYYNGIYCPCRIKPHTKTITINSSGDIHRHISIKDENNIEIVSPYMQLNTEEGVWSEQDQIFIKSVLKNKLDFDAIQYFALNQLRFEVSLLKFKPLSQPPSIIKINLY